MTLVWALIAGYALIAIAVVRPIAGHLAWKHSAGRSSYCVHCHKSGPRCAPSADAWFGWGLCAAAAAAVWPLLLIWLATGHVKIGAESHAQLRAQTERIRELEREVLPSD